MKKPGTSGPGLRSCQRSLGFSVLPEQLDRYRGDLGGPDTTTRARTAGSNGHGIQILPPARGDYQTYDAAPPREVPRPLIRERRPPASGVGRPQASLSRSPLLPGNHSPRIIWRPSRFPCKEVPTMKRSMLALACAVTVVPAAM